MKLVIFPAIDEQRLSRLRDAAPNVRLVNAASPSLAAAEIADAEGFFGKLTPELLAGARRLEWVQSPTASLEHYLFPALAEHPCRLSNMRGLFSDVIADHVLGYMLCFARNLHLYRDRQLRREWAPVGGEQSRPDFETGPGHVSDIDRAHFHLADCSLGVIGVGAIGREICRRAAAFDLEIRGIDPYPTPIDGIEADIRRVDHLDWLLAASRFVVIAAPHTPQTEHMIGEREFSSMQTNGYLINIGRGAIVDLSALTAALESRQIAGAALDVYEQEPLPADHPLWQMPQVILSPHIAAASPRIAERHLETLVENVRRFANGEKPLNVVDKRLWY